MKCTCFKEFKEGDTVYVSPDMKDCNSYCEEHKPENAHPVELKKAVMVLGRRRGGGEFKEEFDQPQKKDKDKVEEPKPEPKIEIPDLPEVTEKDVQITQTAVIKFDKFETIKTTLEENSKVYKSLVMKSNDEDEYKKFKKIRVQLNKDDKLANDIRIKVKKDVLLPYDTFKEDKMDILQNIIQDAKANVEKQIDAYELEVKTQKKKDIDEEFALLQEDFPKVDFLKLDNIFDKKWLNTGSKIKKIKSELFEIFGNANSDLELIGLEKDNGARIKTVYMENGFNFFEAKKTVLAAIKSETEEQARITAAMEANNLVVDKKVIEKVVEKTKEEINNTPGDVVVTSTTKVMLKFAITGEQSVITDIVKYMRGKAVTIKQL